jgi:acetylornithine deacetylase/succinyl-diaminopimelate desuccinylase-like protein
LFWSLALKITPMRLNPPTISPDELSQARQAVDQIFPSALETLQDLVRVPGIAWEAFDSTNLDKSAEAVMQLFKSTGVFDQVEILRASYGESLVGAPAIVATRQAKNSRPTILLYAHHDVQPPGESSLWESEPFEPEIRNSRMYGRGAADDKAGIIAHYSSVKLLS